MLKYFLSFFLLTLSCLCSAQQNDTIIYYQDFPEKFNLQLLGDRRYLGLQLQELNGDAEIEYRPNNRARIGVGGNVVGIGFAFFLKLPEQFGRDQETYGETDFLDIQLNFTQSRFLLELHYINYSGFYVNNAEELPPSAAPYPLRPDLSIEGAAFRGMYLLDGEKLSLRAPYSNVDWQRRGAGSAIAMTAIRHYALSSDSLLLPGELVSFFNPLPVLEDGSITSIALLPGYTRTFVVENFYLNLAFAAGPDVHYYRFQSAKEPVEGLKLALNIQARGALGYDNGKFFTAVSYVANRSRLETSRLGIGLDKGYLVLRVGHRFQDTGWMTDIRNSRLYKRAMNIF